jgi:hypothetical protein
MELSSGFNLRFKQPKYTQEVITVTRRTSRQPTSQVNMATDPVLMTKNLYSEPSPNLNKRKRKNNEFVERPVMNATLPNGIKDNQTMQDKRLEVEYRDITLTKEESKSSYVTSPSKVVGKREGLRKRNEAGKFSRIINGKPFLVENLIMQDRNATTSNANADTSNIATTPKPDSPVRAATVQQQHRRRPKRDLAMNTPPTLEELEAEFGI